MESIIDVFLDNPMLLIAIIVFFICVMIGFFGDRYLKKNRMEDNSKTEGINNDVKEQVEENKTQDEPTSATTTNNGISFVNKENSFYQQTIQAQNPSQNINPNQNSESSYMNNDENINNMF